jgi:hypothetical protein
LGENLVALVALHAVQAAAMNRHHGALNVDEIVLTQLFWNPFQSKIVPHHNTPPQTQPQAE